MSSTLNAIQRVIIYKPEHLKYIIKEFINYFSFDSYTFFNLLVLYPYFFLKLVELFVDLIHRAQYSHNLKNARFSSIRVIISANRLGHLICNII